MTHSMEITEISLDEFSKFVGNRFRNVFAIAKDTGIEGFKMKIVKEEDWIAAKWDSIEGVDDDELLEKVRTSINTATDKFKNSQRKYFYNYLVSYEHSVIGAILKDKGAHMKECKEIMKKKYNLERFPKITIMKYNPNMDFMYRAITLDDLCVDISVKKNGQVEINRYGECILFKCFFTGPPGIRITEVEKDIIRLIAKTTDEISTLSDEENSDKE